MKRNIYAVIFKAPFITTTTKDNAVHQVSLPCKRSVTYF